MVTAHCVNSNGCGHSTNFTRIRVLFPQAKDQRLFCIVLNVHDFFTPVEARFRNMVAAV